MNKLLIVTAALLLGGSTLVMAQAQTQTPAPPLPSGIDNPPAPNPKAAPANPSDAPAASPTTGVGSRPMGPPGNEIPAAGATKDTKEQKKSPN